MGSKQRFFQLPWPAGGLSEHLAYANQEQATKDSPATTVDCANVRNYDPTTQRLRGAQRAGITKYLSSQVNSSNFVQHITQVVSSIGVTGPTGMSVRTSLGLAVAGGTVKSFTSSGFGSTTSGSGALDSTFPYLNSAQIFGVVYFVDGANYKKWTASTDTVSSWTASAGTIPSNGANKPRLICAWRGRIVVSGIVGDAQNWFMSAVGDAGNWDYNPTPTVETMAVAGNNALAGQCEDVINSLMPFNDDLLIMGGDHTIWQMTGDPAAGGRLDLVSDITGIAFGTAWCKDPSGLLYFFGSHGGLWVMTPGALPQRLSANRIEARLASVDLSTSVVRLAWDDRSQSVYIFITPVAGGDTTHYVYDTRNRAFWPDTFSNDGHNPTTVRLMQGDTAAERILLLGCRDGYLRYVDLEAKSDDGTAISSYIWMGPLTGPSGYNLKLRQMDMLLGQDSDPIRYEVYDGASPENAYKRGIERFSGTWQPGRNRPELRTCSANAMFVKLMSNTLGNAWQFEQLTLAAETLGRQGSRVFTQ